MNFVDFVEKYQQEMAPEQMLAIAKAVGKYLSCKLSDVEEHHLCAMVYGVLSEEHFDKHQDDISDYTIHDLAVTMNLMRSDHHVMLERYSKDADELKEMVVLMAIEYLQDPDFLHPTSKIWHTING